MGRRHRLIDLAFRDAMQLIDWRFGGIDISRRNAVEMGMPERRVRRAQAVLYRAGVWNRVDIIVTDYAECRQQVDVLRRRAENSGEYRWLFG